tara:strand:+ start:170 stop:409 length:240 start_codon:yes stop_codon:yes gene_type:complete
VSEQIAKEIIAKLIDALQEQSRKALPTYVQDNWLDALSSVVEGGLYHAWVEVLTKAQLVEIEADVIDIVDLRGDADAAS